MRLSTKAILLNIALTSFVITAAFISLSIEIRRETHQLLEDLLNRSENQVQNIQQDSLAQLLWVSSQITNNPTLRAAMETYRLERSMTSDMRAELLATVQNELDKIWVGLRQDLLIVTNESGIVLASNGPAETLPKAGKDLSKLAVLEQALNPAQPVGERNSGVIKLQGQHYLVGSLPIEMQGFVIGSLTLGDRIDSSFLPNLRAFFGGETLVTVGGQTIASTLSHAPLGEDNSRLLLQLNMATSGTDKTIELAGEDYLVTAIPLGLADSGEPVRLFLLRSLTQALDQPYSRLKKTLATQALAAILLCAILTWVLARASLRPLDRFVAFMRRVADSGDYSVRFPRGATSGSGKVTQPPESQSNNELDLLIDGFNNMLATIEMRDKALRSAHHDLQEGVQALNLKEEELRQSQKMEAIGLLAGGVAHDFNNILMVVSGFSELALRSLDGNHEARSCIEEVQKASKSASLLTRQLLALSRKQIFRPTVINLNELVSELEKILHRVIGESIELSTQLDPDLQPVLVDPTQIEQVLLNLTLNSRDAIETNGKIRIETANADFLNAPHVLISVTDTGSGIDEATQARMFEPFFSTKEKGKGTGLGLSTVHGIVKLCGGHIRVESRPGKGTTIKIYLPPVRQAIEETAETDESVSSAGSETILVVEDEPDVRKIICKLLGLSGYTVLEATGPAEALELFDNNNEQIDLLLTDVIMPVMNGRELHDKIVQANPAVRTLFMSGYTDGVIDEGGILPEGVNFLQKPFTPDALNSEVRKILDQNV